MKRLATLALFGIASMTLAPAAAFARSAPSTSPASVAVAPAVAPAASTPVTGTLADGTGSVDGVFVIDQFVNQAGQLAAVGTFTGTVTDAAGTPTTGTQAVTFPVVPTADPVSCGILHLDLGPLDLDLLGLVVHLDRVVLDISAEPGPGNLLGNLLCAVANLLNGGGPLDQIVGLLNQILALLGGIIGGL